MFGRRWVRNFFRNIALLDQALLYRTMDMPVVITGSGPSLESVLPQIGSARKGIFILAASSSLPALMACGIAPDMVMSTDGGGWAPLHLHACFRTASRREDAMAPAKLAFGLCAAVPSQCYAIPLLAMNDGSLWQSMALHSLGIPSVLVPARGTVTASAIELAMVISSGGIFLAGMDLAVSGIQSHARPYGFDHLFFGTASRLKPVYSQYFMRSGDIKAGGSHDVYAAWFKNRIGSWPQRVFSLGGNHSAFESGLPAGSLERGRKNASDDYFQVMTTNGSPAERRAHALETLVSALDNPQYAAALCGELAPLLFPARTDVSPGDIAGELASMTGGNHG
jgi:hypothetical protein